MTKAIKIIIGILTVTTIFAIVKNYNTRTMQVVKEYGTSNAVVFITKDGNAWEVNKTNTTINEDSKKIKFNTKGTEDVKDDEIIKIYK